MHTCESAIAGRRSSSSALEFRVRMIVIPMMISGADSTVFDNGSHANDCVHRSCLHCRLLRKRAENGISHLAVKSLNLRK